MNCNICNKIYSTKQKLTNHLKGYNKCTFIVRNNKLRTEYEEKMKNIIKDKDVDNNKRIDEYKYKLDNKDNEIDILKEEIKYLKTLVNKPTTINTYNDNRMININCQSINEYFDTVKGIYFNNEDYNIKKINDRVKRLVFNGSPFSLYDVLEKMYTFETLDNSIVIKDKKRKRIILKHNGRIKDIKDNIDFKSLCLKIYDKYIKDVKNNISNKMDFDEEFKKLINDILIYHPSKLWSNIKKDNQLLDVKKIKDCNNYN
jgi:hypothetical protein